MQSIHDETLRFLRRGHTYADFLQAFAGARARGLRVCVHVILGLPGEGRAQMLATAAEMARLQVEGIKIHLLHVLRGTPLGEMYAQGEIAVLGQEEYVSLAADFIERLHPQTLIQRLTGDGPRDSAAGAAVVLEQVGSAQRHRRGTGATRHTAGEQAGGEWLNTDGEGSLVGAGA